MKIGFIGLGIMGKPIVSNLLKANFSVTIYDIDESTRKDMVYLGAIEACSPEHVAKENDIIITMLPDATVVNDVLFGEYGVNKSIAKNAIVIDMSSVSPSDSIKWAKRFKKKNISFLDAPVSGGEPNAIKGTISIMVGGDKKTFEKIFPIFKKMGEEVTLVGDNGSGSTAKLVNQIIVNTNIAALSEAFMFASKAGVNVEKVYKSIQNGLAGSNVLNAKMPSILARNFIAGGRVDINYKDMNNILDTGRKVGSPLVLTSSVASMFQSLIENGEKNIDHSGLLKYYEQLANHKLSSSAAPEEKNEKIITRINNLPKYSEKLFREWKLTRRKFKSKIIVLDDDPTGVQSVHSTPVFTRWDKNTMYKVFMEERQMVFILTNSRSFSKNKTCKEHENIAYNIAEVSKELNCSFLLVSRGDSTLRGHYPIETKVLKNTLETKTNLIYDGEIIIPFFAEGKRFTIDDVHYIYQDNKYIPVSRSEFSEDRMFSFENSDLKKWIAEKTENKYNEESVLSISIDELRGLEIDNITKKLERLKNFQKVIVNAVSEEDIKVFSIALLKVISEGKNFLYRTAASFVKVIGDISKKPLLKYQDLVNPNNKSGGLIVVGSHVQKSTIQLNYLKEMNNMVRTQKGYKSSKFHLNCVIIDVTNIFSEVGASICLNTVKRNIKNHYLISISRLLPSFLSDFKTLGLKAFLLMYFYISMKSVSPSSIVIN